MSTTLKLILGDQLNCRHSWFARPSPDVVFVLMEVRQETDYVLHHVQKIIAIFAAMGDLARRLRAAGHRVHYLAICWCATRRTPSPGRRRTPSRRRACAASANRRPAISAGRSTARKPCCSWSASCARHCLISAATRMR